jgi:uncharacterized protein GlcG (DUF336 family)
MNRRALFVFFAGLAPALRAAELAAKKTLSLEVAKEMAAAAEAFAVKNGWNVVIAILDDGGHLLYFQRMAGVQLGSIEVAQRKALSAVYFKRPSKAFDAGARPAVLAIPNGFPIEGGLPIEHEGQVIGGIGISGVTSEQDGQIAQAGVDALPGILRK